jgi:hypothetical protein
VLKQLTSIALLSGLSGISAGLIGTAGAAEAATVLFSFSGNGRTVTGQLNGLNRGDTGVNPLISNVTTTGFAASNLTNVNFGTANAAFNVDSTTGAVTVATGGSNFFFPAELWLLSFNVGNLANMQCVLAACSASGTADIVGTGFTTVSFTAVPIPFNFHSTLGLTLLGLALVGQQVYKHKRYATIAPVEAAQAE